MFHLNKKSNQSTWIKFLLLLCSKAISLPADGIEIRPSSSMCKALNKPVDSSFRVFEDKRAEFNLFFDG